MQLCICLAEARCWVRNCHTNQRWRRRIVQFNSVLIAPTDFACEILSGATVRISSHAPRTVHNHMGFYMMTVDALKVGTLSIKLLALR